MSHQLPQIPDFTFETFGQEDEVLKYVQAYAELAIASVKREPQWLPIESAPKMTKIIAGYFNKCGKWRTITARYYVENTLQIDDDYRGDEEGYAPAGWYEESESHCENLLPVDEPLMLWMPLPPPPIKDPEQK